MSNVGMGTAKHIVIHRQLAEHLHYFEHVLSSATVGILCVCRRRNGRRARIVDVRRSTGIASTAALMRIGGSVIRRSAGLHGNRLFRILRLGRSRNDLWRYHRRLSGFSATVSTRRTRRGVRRSFTSVAVVGSITGTGTRVSTRFRR